MLEIFNTFVSPHAASLYPSPASLRSVNSKRSRAQERRSTRPTNDLNQSAFFALWSKFNFGRVTHKPKFNLYQSYLSHTTFSGRYHRAVSTLCISHLFRFFVVDRGAATNSLGPPPSFSVTLSCGGRGRIVVLIRFQLQGRWSCIVLATGRVGGRFFSASTVSIASLVDGPVRSILPPENCPFVRLELETRPAADAGATLPRVSVPRVVIGITPRSLAGFAVR
jgi:hypothetical protein